MMAYFIKEGDTAYSIAVNLGLLDFAELLLEHGAKPIQKDSEGNTALISIIKAGIQYYPSEANEEAKKAEERRRRFSFTFDELDAREKLKNLIVKLLEIEEIKDSINEPNKKGETAYSIAVNLGLLDFAELLLEHGAKPPIQKNSRGNTALISTLEIVKRYYPGERIEGEMRFYTVEIDARKKLKDLIIKLLEIEEIRDSINEPNKKGGTAYSIATNSGLLGIAELLLEHGAKPIQKDSNENIALISTIKMVHFPQFNEKEYRGNTIFIAEGYRDTRERVTNLVIKLLEIEEIKDSINELNNEEETAYSIAANSGSLDIVELLLEHGAKPIQRDSISNTALILTIKMMEHHHVSSIHKKRYEARKKRVKNLIIKLLEIKEIRDNINWSNFYNQTAYSMADKLRLKDIMKLLQKHGATP